MSDSLWPHRWQPTRLPRPWDSPGKNTEVGCRFLLECMKVKSESEVAQSCPTLSDPMDCSLPGSSVHGIFQARVLEWDAIAFSILITRLNKISSFTLEDSRVLCLRAGMLKSYCLGLNSNYNLLCDLKWKWKLLSCVWLFVTPWTIQSMEFSRPEYWSGYPFPSPGDLPSLGIELRSPALQVDSLPAEPQGKPKNTGVSSLSLLQGIFPTQESN